jgi:hypothetical protein
MDNSLKKQILLVYDYISVNGILPNGLNHRYLDTYIQNSFCIDNTLYDKIEHLYENPTSVWHGDNVIADAFDGYTSINKVSTKKSNTIYLYTICPFGGAKTSFGENDTLHKGFSFFKFISTKSLDYIKTNNNYFLFINYTNEGVIDHNWFNIIYDELSNLNLPPNKIIFGISNFNIKENFNDWYDANGNGREKIHTIYFNWSRPTKAKEYLAILDNSTTECNPHANNRSIVTKSKIKKETKRPYKFLNFNRRIRAHRLYSILYFFYKNIVPDILISYDFTDKLCIDIDNDQAIKNILYSDDFYVKDTKIILDKIISNAPKKTIDYENIGSVSGLNYENDKPYLDSYIHITSETNFFDCGGYFSEKTWKPIGNLQPFIMIGSHKSLYELKKMGFKTFHPFINENYDNIKNNEDRLIAVLSEIHRISTLSKEDIHDWYFSIMDVLEHNQQLLLSNKSLSVYYKELVNNINAIYENNAISQ